MKIHPAFAAISALALAMPLPSNAHEHIAAGYLDANANNQRDLGEPLRFINPPPPGTVYRLVPSTRSNYAGYFSLDEFPRTQFPNDYFSFTALSDGQAEAANPAHAATGSEIWLQIDSVTGPAGGSFGFWDEGRSFSRNTPSASFATNQPTNDFRFILSEPLEPGPGEDPYGHIHNRGWTATTAGTYQVAFTLLDLGAGGPGGTAFHTASQPYTLTFVAVPEPGVLALLALGGVALTLRARCRRA